MVLPLTSWAVTVITLSPSCKVIVAADQLVVPEALPEPPLLLDQLIEAMQSDAELWNTLERTVESGLLDPTATLSVEQLVTEVFEVAS